jgi:hypothetical protein
VPLKVRAGVQVSPQVFSPNKTQPKQQYAAPLRPVCPLPVIGPPQFAQ